jgi:hypothetical protein
MSRRKVSSEQCDVSTMRVSGWDQEATSREAAECNSPGR